MSGCAPGAEREHRGMIAEVSEKTGQLNLEPFENIVRLKTADGDDWQCLGDQTNAGMGSRP
jgi:hypothetical protein